METPSILHQLCGFLWIRPSGVPYFKWFSTESFDENWNSNDLFFSGFFSAISSSSEIFFNGDTLKFIEFNNYKIYSAKIQVGDIFILITKNSAPETVAQSLMSRMVNRYLHTELTKEEEIQQDSGEVEDQFLQFLAEIENIVQAGDYEEIHELPANLGQNQDGSPPLSSPPHQSSQILQDQVELYEKKLRSLSVLGRTIGHTLNNVLSTIMGNVTLAKLDAKPSSEIYTNLEDAEKSCHRARNLTSQLLTIAKTVQSDQTIEISNKMFTDPHEEDLLQKKDFSWKKKQNLLQTGEGRILLLDDDKNIRETASKMISRLGYEIETAADLKTALQKYKKKFYTKKKFDVVILDLSEIGGLGEFGAMIWHQIDPHVNAIVSSGFSKDPIFQNYEEFGYKSALKKPYNIQELGIALKSVLTSPNNKKKRLKIAQKA